MEIIFALVLALAVMLIWVGSTVFSFVYTRNKDTTFMLTVTVITWGIKFLLVLGAFALLKGYTFYDHNVFAAAVFIVAIISTLFEARYFIKLSNAHLRPKTEELPE